MHTPGPWCVVAADNEVVAGDVCVASAPGWPRDGANDDEREANLHLIAAAPDLLAACRAFLDADEGGDFTGEEKAALMLMRAAIAKAEAC